MIKRGDTLVEVTLAIGIFSMVAVAVVALVNSSTSNAQTALETTLSREEIDVQAEALRFIQNSYIMGPSSGNKYATLWNALIENAVDLENDKYNTLSYNPDACDDLYDKETMQGQGAFIINPFKLDSSDVEDIVLSATDDNTFNKFHPASTYPHLIYASDNSINLNQSDIISRVEGIYIVAVRDNNTTTIITNNNNNSLNPNQKQSAYYDFYIRTCWYGIGAERPSTISTVIRLYNPNLTASDKT